MADKRSLRPIVDGWTRRRRSPHTLARMRVLDTEQQQCYHQISERLLPSSSAILLSYL